MSRMPLAHVSDATSSACVDLEAVAPEMEGFGTVTVHSIPSPSSRPTRCSILSFKS